MNYTSSNIQPLRSGQVVIHSLSTPESYAFDMKRPIRTVAMEPNFAKRSTRAFVCGGMAGSLILREKGWLGHRETVLHAGEGPIWHVRWRGGLIAWANDLVSVIYHFLDLIYLDESAGREDIRYRFAIAYYIHRPAGRQPPRRPIQMYNTLARRLDTLNSMGGPYTSCPYTCQAACIDIVCVC